MKLAISNISWSKEHDETIHIFLKEQGINSLEIAPTRTFNEVPYDNLTRARRYLKEYLKPLGFQIVSLQSIWYGRKENIFTSEEERNLLRIQAYKAIDLAVALECQNIVFGNPKQRNGYKSSLHGIVINFFKDIAEYAKKKEIIISIEPNPEIYGTNFLNSTHETIMFVQELDHPNIKLNLDIGTMIENNEKIEDIMPYIHEINHIHLSEPYLKPILKREIHTQLKDLRFNGYLSIEMSNIVDIDELKKIIIYVKGLLND